MNEFFKDLLTNKKHKIDKPKTTLDKLYEKPKDDKDVEAGKFPYPKPNFWQQCDLLFLPNDKGFTYCLVVVDIGSRQVDAEPLQSKNSVDVLKALNTIWKRKILNVPKILTTDQGNEFKGDVVKGLNKLDIILKIAKTGRHRQVALVERKNQTIGNLIHKLIIHDELATGKSSSSWTKALPIIIKVINEKVKENFKKQKDSFENRIIKVDDMLQEGDNVRVQLDNPMSLQGNKLHGRFRSGDIRFNPTIRTIKYILIKQNQPPIYLLDGNHGSLKVDTTGYTRNQLQLVSHNEILPTTPIMDIEDDRYEVEKIIGKKIEKGKIFYLIKWKGYNIKDATYEPKDELMKDIPQRIKRYEESLKK